MSASPRRPGAVSSCRSFARGESRSLEHRSGDRRSDRGRARGQGEPRGAVRIDHHRFRASGALGGIAATPIVKPPEVAIVGVNKIVERPVVRDGHIVIRKMMNLSSSFDHRVVDGFDAASFIQTMKGYLEVPARMFIEAS